MFLPIHAAAAAANANRNALLVAGHGLSAKASAVVRKSAAQGFHASMDAVLTAVFARCNQSVQW